MKVLVIEMEDAGCGLDFVLRCVQAGHAVRYFKRRENNQQPGKGFPGVEHIENWALSIRWADLVWCTGNDDFMERLDAYRAKGVKFFGPSAASAKLEVNRESGMKFFEKHGIECPAYKTFNSLDEALAYQMKSEDRHVFKTLGDEEDKSLSYVGKTPADMVARIQRWKKLGMTLKGPCMLQEFIPGIEMGVSRWMSADGFIGMPNENFEHKKLLSGNCGPNCGEAGTVQKYAKNSKLYQAVLAPLEEGLMKLNHLGDVDVNCIISEKGKAYPLEFTMRAGWPAMNIMLATHKGDPAQWMLDACNGEDSLEASTAISAGVVFAQPDYPYSKATKAETLDVPIYGVTDKNRRFIAPQSVRIAKLPQMKGDKVEVADMWATCGDYLLVATGTGKTVKLATQRAYDTIKQLHVPDAMWRDDIGEGLEKSLPDLQRHGYATEFTYG